MNKIAAIVLATSLFTPHAIPLDQTNQNPFLGKRVKASIPPRIKKYLPAQGTVHFAVIGAALSTLTIVMMNYLCNNPSNKMFLDSAYGTVIFALLGYDYDVTNNPDVIHDYLEKDLLVITIKFMNQHPKGTSVDYWTAHHSDIEKFICKHTGKSAIDERYREFGNHQFATYLKNESEKLDVVAIELLIFLNDWRNEEHHIKCYTSLYYDVHVNNELLKNKLLSLAEYLENPEKFDA